MITRDGKQAISMRVFLSSPPQLLESNKTGMKNCSEKNMPSLRGASPVTAQSRPAPHQLQEPSAAAMYLTELIKQVPEHPDRLSLSPAQVSRGHLVHLAKAAHPTDTVGTLDTHHRQQRGQTSTDHIITRGRRHLPPNPGTREVPRAPCTHPT